MSNQLERQITLDGYRNAVVKFTGVIDSTDAIEAPALVLSDMKTNDPLARLVGFRLDMIEWSMSQGLEIVVEWNSANPQQIMPIAGRGRIYAHDYGGFTPDQLKPGFDGAINLRSQSYQPGTIANFTVVLELIKLYVV